MKKKKRKKEIAFYRMIFTNLSIINKYTFFLLVFEGKMSEKLRRHGVKAQEYFIKSKSGF